MIKSKLAAEVASEFPTASDRQLARILCKRHPIAFTKFERAWYIVRRIRGSIRTRKAKTTVAKQTKLQCPDSKTEPWVPFEMPGKRILIFSDMQIPFHDRKVIETSVKYAKRCKVNSILINGDLIDFYAISRFQRRPDRRDAVEEIELTKKFLGWLRQEFPRIPIVFRYGNHENRWDRLIWDKAPELFSLQNVQLHNVLGLEKFKVIHVPDSPILIAKLAVFHGHELAQGANSPVGPARSAFLKTLDSVLISHHHRTSTNSEPNWRHDEHCSWSIGCMCYLYPEFARINKWDHSFAIVEWGKAGQFDVQCHRIGKGYQIRSS